MTDNLRVSDLDQLNILYFDSFKRLKKALFSIAQPGSSSPSFEIASIDSYFSSMFYKLRSVSDDDQVKMYYYEELRNLVYRIHEIYVSDTLSIDPEPLKRLNIRLWQLKNELFILSEKLSKLIEPKKISCFTPKNEETQYQDILNQYIFTGSKLCNTKEIHEIRDALNDLCYDPEKPSMFAVLIGPSLSGKAQVAFALAHHMNVLYLSFSRLKKMHEVFRSISNVFESCIGYDLNNVSSKSSQIDPNEPFYTVSLLMFFLKKNLTPKSVEDRFMDYIETNTTVYRKSINTFKSEIITNKIDLSSTVVFLDIYLINQQDPSQIIFFKSICCALNIPIIFSSPCPQICNLIDDPASICPKRRSLRWVKVITTLPKTDFSAICHAINFKHWKDQSTELILSLFCCGRNGCLDLDELFGALFDVSKVPKSEIISLKRLFQFFEAQTPSRLPGLIQLLFRNLILSFRQMRDEPITAFGIWENALRRTKRANDSNSTALSYFEAPFETLNMLTPEQLRIKDVTDEFSHSMNQGHVYNFNDVTDKDQIYDLSVKLDKNNQAKFMKKGKEWTLKCNLPDISTNFLAHVGRTYWERYFFHLQSDRTTMLMLNIDGNKKEQFIDSTALRQNNKLQAYELLVHWVVMYSSRIDNFEADGLVYQSQYKGPYDGTFFVPDVFWNIALRETYQQRSKFYLKEFSPILRKFLKSFHVPFLVNFQDLNEAIKDSKPSFMLFGESVLVHCNTGSGVVFDAFFKGKPSFGLVECTLMYQNDVGLSSIYNYYKRSIDLKCRLTVLVVNEYSNSLVEDFTVPTRNRKGKSQIQERLKFESKIHTKKTYKKFVLDTLNESICEFVDRLKALPKFNSNSTRTIEDYNALWADSNSNVNIYAIRVHFYPTSNEYLMEFSVIKEFKNPTGIFLVMQRQMIKRQV